MIDFKPLTKIEVIDADTKHRLLNAIAEESQIIIHGSYKGGFLNDKCRICEPVYIMDKNTSQIGKLVYAENIASFPKWNYVEAGRTTYFTLVLEYPPDELHLLGWD